ncbi:MAG: hypothetical protein ABR915_14575 [Thermoguttaceae bacterium]|jgi:hypothetical protein
MNTSSVQTALRILRDELFPGSMPSAAGENPPHDLRTKADFVRAVEALAGDFSRRAFAESDIYDMKAVFVLCPYNTWKQTFGEPRDVEEYHVAACHRAVRMWEQPCSDGVVRCVGYFVDDPHDGRWVVLTRVCLF